MLSFCRRLTRPLTVALLVLLVAPAAVDCCELTSAHGDALACCLKQNDDGPKMDADCCVVEQSPANQQAPGTTPVTAGKMTVDAAQVPASAWSPISVPTVRFPIAETISPPADPLYLRLSRLRR